MKITISVCDFCHRQGTNEYTLYVMGSHVVKDLCLNCSKKELLKIFKRNPGLVFDVLERIIDADPGTVDWTNNEDCPSEPENRRSLSKLMDAVS